jgi:hypothetical protein
MALAPFLYPIVDSGFFFEFTLQAVVKQQQASDYLLTIRYSLTNIQAFSFQIPINISYQVYLDCEQGSDFTHTTNRLLSSDHVVDVQTNAIMRGYGADHHVGFQPAETKAFVIVFKPTKMDFQTIDISFPMKRVEADYGLYWLRYDVQTRQLLEQYCERTYPVRKTPTLPSVSKKRS